MQILARNLLLLTLLCAIPPCATYADERASSASTSGRYLVAKADTPAPLGTDTSGDQSLPAVVSGPAETKVEVHFADLNEVQIQLRCLLPVLACQISDARDAVTLRGPQELMEPAKEIIRVMDYERSQPGSAGNARP